MQARRARGRLLELCHHERHKGADSVANAAPDIAAHAAAHTAANAQPDTRADGHAHAFANSIAHAQPDAESDAEPGRVQPRPRLRGWHVL